MNSTLGTEMNDVINNLCDKLGVTVNVLVPEFARYKIASGSIWLIFSAIIIITAIFSTVYIIRKYKYEGEYIRIYKEDIDKLGDVTDKNPGRTNGFIMTSDDGYFKQWKKLYNIGRIHTYDETDYCIWICCCVITWLVGIGILCCTLPSLIGWKIAPYASFVDWLVKNITQ